MEFEVMGKGWEKIVVEVSALERRPILGGRVMVVTAHQAEIAAIEQVLPADGLVLTTAGDGKTALETAGTMPPDLVIIDAKLADGDGAGFIQPLRNLLARPDLPIIILTEGQSICYAETTSENTHFHLLNNVRLQPLSLAPFRLIDLNDTVVAKDV